MDFSSLENKMYCWVATDKDFDSLYEASQNENVLLLKAYYKIRHFSFAKAKEILKVISRRDSSINKNSYYLTCLIALEFEQGNVSHAKNILNQIIEDDSKFKNKWLMFEFLRIIESYDSDELQINLDYLIRDHPRFLPGLLMKAKSSLDSKKEPKRILNLFKYYLKEKQDCYNLEMCNILAGAYLNLGDPNVSLKWIERSLNVMESSDAYMLLAFYHDYKFDDFSKSEEYYLKATAIDPENLEAYMNWFSMLYDQGYNSRLQEVIDNLNLKSLDQRFISVLGLSYLLKMNLFEEAIIFLDKNKEVFLAEIFAELKLLVNQYSMDKSNLNDFQESENDETYFLLDLLTTRA